MWEWDSNVGAEVEKPGVLRPVRHGVVAGEERLVCKLADKRYPRQVLHLEERRTGRRRRGMIPAP